MILITAPENPIMNSVYRYSIFLAGSIEQDKAENWQQRLIKELADVKGLIIYNPRRKVWNADLAQEMANEQFNEQVTWELRNLKQSTYIPLYFQPGTKSPISLLELGLFADTDQLIVCCPEGFWRKGNVDIICRDYNIPQVDTLDELVETVKDKVK